MSNISLKVREKVINIDLKNKSTSTIFTNKINGRLEGFIIDSDKRVRVRISFEDFDDIVLFNTGNEAIVGQKYYPIGLQIYNDKMEVFSHTNDKYYLNNKLKIEIDGQINGKIKLIIRYI